MNYEKLLQVILDIAEEMLVCGAEVDRVEDSIERMCSAYGCPFYRINVFIITSNIQVTLEDPDGNIITQIRRIIRNDTNFDKLDYLNDLSRYVCANTPSIEEMRIKFEEVMDRKEPHIWLEFFGAIMVASGFAVFFGGDLWDAVAAAPVAVVITLITKILGRIEENQMAKLFVSSLIAGSLTILCVSLGLGHHVDKIMIGGIMLLIPGIAMTNSVKDMLIGDIVTGMLRFVNALLMAAAIAVGFALPLILTGGGGLI